jgi:predicted site-specific integrase-resolvase
MRGYEVVAVISEQASSLNEKRKGMKKLLGLIKEQALEVVLIEYPDRLYGSRAKGVRAPVKAALKEYEEGSDGTGRADHETGA